MTNERIAGQALNGREGKLRVNLWQKKKMKWRDFMSEKRLNNTIFLMFLVTSNYCKKYNITPREFLDLDKRYAILNYVSECPDVFDGMTDSEMVEEVDQYVS